MRHPYTIKRTIPEGWVVVPMRELRSIWAAQMKDGTCFTGCTNAALVNKYGYDNVMHIRGFGWIKKAGA